LSFLHSSVICIQLIQIKYQGPILAVFLTG
jgi:hypothetical protein